MTEFESPGACGQQATGITHCTKQECEQMTIPSVTYEQFLRNKAIVANPLGIEIDPQSLHPCLKHHQREMVLWMCRMGRAACFASFGLGKTVIQLETVRQVRHYAGGMGLIVAPLGVRGEFMRDAAMLGIDLKFIRTIEEAEDSSGIYITNYETIRDGKLDPRAFTVSSLDEAAVLRGFGSTLTFREFMRAFDGIRYKFIATATPSPNEYIELLAYSAYLEVMEVGEGKAQPLDAKILTPAGWVSMGDILEGDDVIAGDGSITKVIGVYPQGEQDIYRLTCNDGATTECTSEHLWLTTTHYERNNLRRYKDRNPDGERKYASVKTTAEILETLKVKQGINHVIPKPNPVFQYRRPITINPYLLGALIGDACLRKTSVVFSTGDDWMSDTVEKLLPEGLFLRRIKPELGDFSITANGKRGGNGPGSNILLQNLRDYGLLGKRSFEKFIPVDYLESSEEDRLNMLRGLMDTDGTIGKKSQQTTFSTTSYKLAQDVVYLVRSLGGTASIRNDSVCSLTRNQAYIVEVRLDVCPFMMPRKAALHKKRNIRATSRYVTGVEMIGRKEAQCIAVEHPSQLYVTDDFIVTHNTRFFKRDSTKADKLTLHAHKEREFWLWVSSWALFVQTPSDIGGDDTGYALPELRVHWHEIPAEHTGGQKDEHGQSLLFDAQAMGLQGAAKEKRESLERRVAKAREIVQNSLDPQCVIWCDLNAEQDAIGKMLKAEGISMSSLYGSQGIDEREKLMDEWRAGERQAFVSKSSMYGSGCNLQRCHTMVFTGIGFRFADFIQACHRIHRFQQSHDCDVHLIYTENERQVRQILERKWAQHITLTRNMSGIIKEFGLDNLRRAEAMSRALGVEREEVKTDHFHVIHNDTVLETRSMLANSVGLILTSVPFSNQYEYSPNYADFGHSDNNDHFFSQMDYLTPELLRVLKPGRMAVIHVKDRIVPGGMTGLGFQTVYPFHARCIDHYTRHGFGYMGMKTIVTDVVRENNQTYRLGWTEQCKDGTKMGVGMPEYLLLFRKPQSDTSRSYTDDPVTKPKPLVFATDEDRKQPWEQRKRAAFKASDKRPCVRGTGYSRARWQIDAHGFARSSGDRFPTTEEIRNMPHAAIFKAFRKWGLENIYEYEQHVGIGEDMEEDARLPVSFMLLQPPSWHPDVWTDIARMRCLNGEQKHKGKIQHLCPLAFDIADRVINQMSDPGDIVFDPFGGLMTVPYRAIKHGRYGMGVELATGYYQDGLFYCRQAVQEKQMPSLFDFLDAEEDQLEYSLEEAA